MADGDRRVRVFVSSRMKELSAERQVAKRALEQLGVAAWVFEEDAGARPTTIQQTYLDALDKSDLYIGVFWRNSGRYTIEEYRHARHKQMDCLIYEKQVRDGHRDTELQSFLDEIGRVESGVTVRRFVVADELDRYLRQDVAAWQADKIHERSTARSDAPLQAPPLADSYVERKRVLEQLAERLLASAGDRAKRVTRAVLYGPPGVGKTVIASAFARNERVSSAYPDGVLWLSLGEEPDLTRALSELARSIRDSQLSEEGFQSREAGVARLRSLMRDRAYLLVVDDAWDRAHVEDAFLIGGPKCLLLVTTRDARIASSIGAERIELTPMIEGESIELMSRWAGPISPDDENIARRLAEEVGHLPLALELIGARVGALSSWNAYEERWRKQGFGALTRGRGSRGRRDSVHDSLELSLKLLADDDRRHYLELGIFARKGLFPASAAATLWGFDVWEAADVLDDLAGQAILLRRKTDRGMRYGFHDLLHDFVLEQIGDTGALQAHARLLENYGRGHADWPSVPDDGYLFDQLSYHLIQAKRGNELIELLTTSPDWMNTKAVASGSDSSLTVDLDRALGLNVETTQLVALYAIKHVVKERLGSLTDTDLRTLVWRDRIDAAVSRARTRPEPETRSASLLAVYQELSARGDLRPELLDEAALAAREISEGSARAAALQAVGTLQFATADSRWSSTYDEARDAAITADWASARSRALLGLADALREMDSGKAQEMLDAAARVARQVSENDNRTETLTAVAFACARAGRPDDALGLLAAWEPGYRYQLVGVITDMIVIAERIGDLSPISPRNIAQLLSYEGNTRAPSEIRQLSLFIRALRGEQDASDAVLSAAKEEDSWGRAMASKLHRCLAARLAEAGDFERAREELREVSARGDHADALVDTVQAAETSGYAEIARIVSDEAPSHRPRKPGEHFSDDELITHSTRAWRLLFQVGRPGEALELIASLVDHDRGLALEELLPELDRIDLADRAPYLERADELTHEIGSQYWRRGSALRALALAYAKARHERADLIAEEAWSASRSRDSWWMREALIFGAAEIFALAGLVAQSRRILASLDPLEQVEGLCGLARWLFDRSDDGHSNVLEEAIETARAIDHGSDRAHASILLTEVLGHVGDPRWRALFREAEHLALEMEDEVDPSASAKTLARLVDCLTRLKRFDEALEITDRIDDASTRAQRRAHVAMALARANDPRCEELFSEAKSILISPVAFPQFPPGVVATNHHILIIALAEGGRYDETIDVARLDFREDDRSTTLAAFTRMLIRAGRLDDALEVAHWIASSTMRAAALVDLALAMADRDRATSRALLDEVRESGRGATHPDRKASILCQAVRGLARVGQLADAQVLADTIPLHNFRAAAFGQTADAARETNPELADMLLGRALSEARSISDATERQNVIRTLVDTVARAHGLRRGLEALETDSVDEFIGTLERWAALLGQEGDGAESLRRAMAIAGWVRPDWKAVSARLDEHAA